MLDLKQYVPNGRVSSGLLAWYKGRLVWCCAQPKYWATDGDITRISLIGVGGGQEAGETLMDTIKREAMEEAHAEIREVSARRTVWVTADGKAEVKDLSPELAGEPAPLLIWQRQVTLRQEDSTPYLKDYINPVYEAAIMNEPYPGMETPGLFILPLDLFRPLLHQPRPLAELLAAGMSYVGAELPANTVLELSGSAEHIARYWEMLERQEGKH
jgi:8-oxo-dGTP pyrophosphatase MutT (NUDIX family)